MVYLLYIYLLEASLYADYPVFNCASKINKKIPNSNFRSSLKISQHSLC